MLCLRPSQAVNDVHNFYRYSYRCNVSPRSFARLDRCIFSVQAGRAAGPKVFTAAETGSQEVETALRDGVTF